jgi:hypothetical protein
MSRQRSSIANPNSIAELFTHGDIRYRPLRLWLSGHSSPTFITPSKAMEPSRTESLITAA